MFCGIINAVENLLFIACLFIWGISRGRFENSTELKGRKNLVKSRDFKCY